MGASVAKSYVINLHRRTDRYEAFQNRVAPFGMDFERFDAIDGASVPRPVWFWPPDGAWGCFLSHLFLLSGALSRKEGNILVVEDDCVFREGFCDRLKACLSDLPDDWDMLYLGGQHLKEDVNPPVMVSPNIAKAYAVNLTTGYIINEKAIPKVLAAFYDFDRFRKPGIENLDCIQHVDRQFVEMAQSGTLAIYAACPWLCGQDAGTSDVGCYYARTECQFYDTTPKNGFRKIGDGIVLRHHRVAYGEVGIDGNLGYEGKTASPPFRGQTLSLHAPSSAVVTIDRPLYLYAYIDGNNDALPKIKVQCNNVNIGTIYKSGEYTEPVLLKPGHYTLDFISADKNDFAHSVWCFREEPFTPLPAGSWVEVISNSFCPRHCPECNQNAFMRDRPDYQYTTEDAKALVSVLEKNKAKISVLFSGGEPKFCHNIDGVVQVLRNSPSVDKIGITTSQDDEEHIRRIKSMFDVIFVSKRTDMKWFDKKPPAYLKGCIIWGAMSHVAWPSEPFYGEHHCCCADVGVRCSIIGQKVQACVVAESLRIMGRWPSHEMIDIEDYFSGRKTFGKIGNYEACAWCVNNREYRMQAERVTT